VHRTDDAQLADAGVGDLARDEMLRHHPDDTAARSKRGVGDGAHQADVAAAVDERARLCGQRTSERFGGVPIRRPRAGARAAEHADGGTSTSH
jgi:hypothetical protein